MEYKDHLFNYITDVLNIKEEISLKKLIVKHKLFLTLNNDFIQNTFNPFNKLIKSKMNIFYNIYLQEYTLLSKCIKDNNISAAFVKGLVLSHMLYEDPLDRLFGDIDLYININNINEFLDLIGTLGYIDNDGEIVTSSKLGGYYHRSHLKPFHKKINYNGNSKDIILEIHIIPFHINIKYPSLYDEEKSSIFYNNIIYFEIGSLKIPTLCLELHFLFLLDHVIKHLLHDMTDINTKFELDSNFDINLNKIYETKIFYDKYKNKMDINKVEEFIDQYNIGWQINLALKYVNEIFNNDKININIYKNNDLLNQIVENKICSELEKFTLSDLILEDINLKKHIYNQLHSRDFNAGYTIKIPKKADWIIGNEFIVDENKPINLYGTHFKEGYTKPKNKYENSFSVTMLWDYKYLYFNLILLDNNFPVNNHGKSFSILFDSSDYLDGSSSKIKGLNFRVFEKEETERGYEAIIIDGDYLINVTSNFMCSFSVFDGVGLSALIALPWDIIGIEPDSGVVFGFDIKTIRYDKDRKCESLLAISDISDLHNERNYAKAELVN